MSNTNSNLVFSESYFEEEKRLGFTISSMMKRAWAAQLEVLTEVDRVCSELNINYYADLGTLLGAIRHNGYIPWDDDLDICMLREDYYVFLREAPELLDKWYEVISLYNDPSFDTTKARIINGCVNGRHINFDKEYLDKFHACPYVVGIDIFPIDNMPDNDGKLRELREVLDFLLKVEASIPEEGPYSQEVINIMKDIERKFGMPIDYNNRLRHEVKKIYDVLSAFYMDDKTHGVGYMMGMSSGMSEKRFDREAYSFYKRVPFENTTIPIVKCYKDVLVYEYGEDYMTPVNKGASHDYPFYREQVEGLREVLEREYNKEFTYEFVEEFIQMKVDEVYSDED